MKLLSTVSAPPTATSCDSTASCYNTYKSKARVLSVPLLKIISVFAFLALPVAQAHAENTAEAASLKKSVTSREYRYNEPYNGLEHADVKENSEQTNAKEKQTTPNNVSSTVLPSKLSGQDTGKEVNGVSKKTVLTTSPIDAKQAARIEQHTNTSKSSSSIVISSVNEFWIYDSWVSLQQDLDYDGYFSTFSVEFDADTIFVDAPVYAVLYLGQNGVYDAIHVSSEFFIYGEDSSDSFVIESTLVSGFPSFDYDVLLELYDANTEQLVAFSDGYDNAEFAFVPLESETNEYIVEDTIVIVEEYGGSMSWMALFAIIIAAGLRRSSKGTSLK